MERTPNEREAVIIRQLLIEDRELWNTFSLEPVSDNAEEMCCGWKPVRPAASYDLTKPVTKRRNVAAALETTSTLSLHSKKDATLDKYPYMSGELDENYSYVYKGGLSSRAETSTVQTTPLNTHKHVQTVTLVPSQTSDASVEAYCRAELSRVLSLQLKPELLVEQLIIENRLRTMSLAAFPILESSETRCGRQTERMYSHSTPALPNTHVNYQSPKYRQCKGRERNKMAANRRCTVKPLPHMEWCDSLSAHRSQKTRHENSTDPNWPLLQVSHRQSALHLRDKSRSFKQTPPQDRKTSKPSSHPCMHIMCGARNVMEDPLASSQYRLPVVSPSLTDPGRHSKSARHMHSLLYQPDRLTDDRRHPKSSSLMTGSSFYYPHVSYSNSKPMKFK